VLRILFGPWSFDANPLWIVLGIGALFFFSMALSFAQNQKRGTGQAIGLGLLFVLIGDAILYAAYNALGFPQNYHFSNVAIYSYGFMLMVAFIVATIFLINRGKRDDWRVSSDTVLDLMTFIIIGSIVGARLLYVALEWNTQYGPDAPNAPSYASSADALKAALLNVAKINEGGLSFHGGILGALFAGYIYTAARRLHFWRMVDFVTPAIPLGGIFGRIGCFLNGCCFGVPVETIPGVKMATLGDDVARHPAQLYEAFGHLLLYIYLASTEKSAKFPGHLFLRFIVGYSWVRFVIEWFRFDATAPGAGTPSAQKLTELPVLGWITVAQAASLLVIIVGSIIIKMLTRKFAPPKPRAKPEESDPLLVKPERDDVVPA